MTIAVPGLIDTHMHVYEAGAAVNPNAIHQPEPGSTVADYRLEMARVGIERAVVIHPTAYGTDNACTVNAVRQLGDAGRGVAILGDDAPEEEIARLAAHGIVGVRCVMWPGKNAITWDGMRHMAPMLAAHGWLMDVFFDARHILERYELLAALPCTVVIEHLGLYLEQKDIDGPEVAAMLRLLDSGKAWVKLSSPEAPDDNGVGYRRDMDALGRKLVAHAPDRCVWGGNWPHAGFRELQPDSRVFLERVMGWIESPEVLHKVMVVNPEKLYRFSGAQP